MAGFSIPSDVQPLLRVEGLAVARGYRRILDAVSLTMRAGDIVQLCGANGSGKTSLLECLAGLRQTEAGQVQLPPPEQVLWLGHRNGMAQELDARQNLRAWCRLHGLSESGIDAALQRWRVPRHRRPLSGLSAGQQQRAALASLMLHKRARLWLLDEPAAALDAEGVPLLAQSIRSFAESGGAVVFTTHQKIADLPARTLMLDTFAPGRAIAEGAL